MVIGVSGKYCSGKNTVCAILETKGWTSLDADKLGHEALRLKKKELTEIFSGSILAEDGEIDRRKLGAIVFSSKSALEKLENIVHPWIHEKCREFIKKNGKPVLNVPLIHKRNIHKLCSIVVWVKAPLLVRISRALKRDRISLVQILKRIWAQRKLNPKYLLKDVDIYIMRNGRNGDLTAQIDSFLKR